MLLRLLMKDKQKRERIAHIVAGAIIFFHGYEKYDSGHDSYLFFFIAGAVFLLIALLHPVFEKRFPWIDGVFFVIEGLLSLIVAWDYFHAGKKGLPIAWLLASLFQFFAAYKKSKKGITHHKEKVAANKEAME
jgi:hypothetical protein